jgi:protein O-GlcNAc transferase
MDDLSDLLRSAFEAFRQKRYAEAEQLYRQVLTIAPAHGVARHTLGVIADLTGRTPEAIDHMRQAVAQMGGDHAFFYNFGLMLQKRQKYDEAIKNYREAVRLKPDYVAALNNLGAVALIKGCLTEAEDVLRRTIAVKPDYYLALNNLGSVCKDQGRYAEAIEFYRAALAIKPTDDQSGSNLLLTCCYCRLLDKSALFREHCRFDERMRAIIPVSPRPPVRINAAGEPLRIGYLSPDFRTHSIAYFIEPILKNHDRSRFIVTGYSDGPVVDKVSQRLQKCCDHWCRIQGLSDEAAAAQIAADRIDILVDLSGHSGYNRLPLFMRRVAPVQVTYLGYPNTTGLSTMDFRITDALADPPGEEAWHTEKLVRIPAGFLCYSPPPNAPDVASPPLLRNGYITFGSFNNLPKITPEVIAVWANILKALPTARLMIKTKPFIDEAVRCRYLHAFEAEGIALDRLHFVGHTAATGDHLRNYNDIDISLDTFPYNGTTTTLESLWMGVPVVTLAGNAHAGRVGVSILTRIGLTGMIADSLERYCAIALFLANDAARLDKLRLNLRAAVAASPLCNGVDFTRSLEQAYTAMWEKSSEV